MAAKQGKRKTASVKSKSRKVIDRKPAFQGWRTTDAEEIERRRWRGATEFVSMQAIEPQFDFFGTFSVPSSSTESDYVVEIRSLVDLDNSCGCRDFGSTGLGTCKHIEGVLQALGKASRRGFKAAAKSGSPRIEVYPAVRDGQSVQIMWPTPEVDTALRDRISHLVGSLRNFDGDALAGLHSVANENQDKVRISAHIETWLEERLRVEQRVEARASFVADVAAGRRSADNLSHPLLPYQFDGMLHLAFGERTLLADDMGLGKTVQAIAACDLLRRLSGVERVIVVCPASLKSEWQEQIARFTDLPTRIVAGPRSKRLSQYRDPAFFTLANYEQILVDGPDINRILAPQIVILDEAQRIKNWQTKTARAVKGLQSRYAFVLTGTPIENRIDEIYSIVQYLDPRLLGPLFRFNRDFYVLDERGNPMDYKNLDELGQKLKPVMLRRRKSDVEDQLPGRTLTNYFVAMTTEQRLRYADYELPASRLLHAARKRPLTKEEFERLQQLLACMRMICDTPYILDPACRDCPKLEELERLLGDLLVEDGRKIIIFSEWVRMLEMVRELAVEMGVEFAWHTGEVPQDRRRAEINRFKKDLACRLFLSSDSGSVGLNLQAADTVINMDLPWNPAKLEQRIARAWRKHQTRAVSVVNLVCEDSIEHRMVHLLAQKQGLADAVLDGLGDVNAIRMPTGRAAFVERMEAMMAWRNGADTQLDVDPKLRLRDELLSLHGDGLLSLVVHRDSSGRECGLVVVDGDPDRMRKDSEAMVQASGLSIEFIDRAAFELIRRLQAAGILQNSQEASSELHRSPCLDVEDRRHLDRARKLIIEADRKFRMATLLEGGGFEAESSVPANDAAILGLRCLAVACGENDAADDEPRIDFADRLTGKTSLPAELHRAITQSLDTGIEDDPVGNADPKQRLADIKEMLVHARGMLEPRAGSNHESPG